MANINQRDIAAQVMPEVELVKLICKKGKGFVAEDPNTWGLIGAIVKVTKGKSVKERRYSLKDILALKDKAKLKGFTIVNPGTEKAFIRRTRGQLMDLPIEYVETKLPKQVKEEPVSAPVTQGIKSEDASGENKKAAKTLPEPKITIKAAKKAENNITFEEMLKIAKRTKGVLLGVNEGISGENGGKAFVPSVLISPQLVPVVDEGRYYLNCFLPAQIWHKGQGIPALSQVSLLVASFKGKVKQSYMQKLVLFLPEEIAKKELGAFTNLTPYKLEDVVNNLNYKELGYFKEGNFAGYALGGLLEKAIKIGKENQVGENKANSKDIKKGYAELDTYRVLSKFLSDVRSYFQAIGLIEPAGGNGCHEIYKGYDDFTLEALAEVGLNIATRVIVVGKVIGKSKPKTKEAEKQELKKSIIAWIGNHCGDIDDIFIKSFMGVVSDQVSQETVDFTHKALRFLSSLAHQVRETKAKGGEMALDAKTTEALKKISETISERLRKYSAAVYQGEE